MSVALINEVLRDFERYSGDGKPNAPVGHPLPVGDPRSGIHNPAKYRLRELLLSILQAMGDPAALQDILNQLGNKADISELRDGRVYSTPGGDNPSGLDIPDWADTLLLQNNAGGTISKWRPIAAPDDGLETDVLKKDANGRWWQKLEDSDVGQERTERITADNEHTDAAGTINLVNVAGTGDAVTAEFPAGVGTPSFVAEKLFRMTWPADSTVAEPEVTVATVTRKVRDTDLGILPEGFMKSGRSYLFETYGSQYARLVSDAQNHAERYWQRLEIAKLLADLSSQLAGADGYPNRDVMRLTQHGIRMFLDPVTGDDAFRKGAAQLGPLRVDGGRDLLSYGTGGGYKGAFARIYPDRVEIPGLAVQDPNKQVQATFYGPYAADTFEEINGLKLPSRLVNGKPREAELHSTYGQSNGDQATTNEAALWNSTSPWAYHTMMPNDATTNENRGGMIGWAGMVPPGFSSLVYADASKMADRQFYGDASIQALNFLRPGPKPLSVYRSSAWGGNKLVGDDPGEGLWKDSDGGYTQAWLNWQQDIAQMYASVSALGYPVKRLFINFTHQEEDWQTPRATYLQQANEFKSEIEAYIATIDPALEVLWFVDQASGSGLRSPKYMGNAWPDRMAIVDFANQHDNVTMVMPRYWMKFGYVGDPAIIENIHHDKRSKAWQGEMYAHAKNEVIAGRAWKCPQDFAAVIDGNDVVIEFDTMGPLQLDWTFCKVRPDGGFQLWNPASGFNYDMTTFTDNAEWDLGVGSVTYVGSVTTVSNNQGGNISPVTQNKVYRISGDIQRLSGTTARVRIQIRWLSSENPDTVISVTSGDYITLSDAAVNVLINEGMPPAGANFFDLMLTVDGANTDGQVEFSNVAIEATPTPAENVRVIAHNRVACTFPTAPMAGQFIRYAYRTQDMGDVSDVWPIGTGALRDDWEAMSVLDPGKKLIRAALGFERAL